MTTKTLTQSSRSMLQWQWKTLLSELGQVRLHGSDDSCPCNQVTLNPPEYCLAKHLLNISSLAAETSLMDEASAGWLQTLSSEAGEHHEAAKGIYCKGGEWPDLAGWAREWSKKIEPLYYTCRVKAKLKQEPGCILEQPGRCTVASMEAPAPFGWPGGKSQLSSRIVPLIPAHRTYVEPFAGAAAVFWRKERSEVEVLNDLDPDLMRFYRKFSTIKMCDIKKLSKDWDVLKQKEGRLEPCEFLSLVACSFGEIRGNRAPQAQICKTNAVSFHSRLSKYQERIRGVKLHTEDWERTVRRYDAPDTFFYFDPPYHGTARRYRFGDDQLERLTKVLPKLKGKWILSYDNHPDVRRAFSSYHIIAVTSRYTIQSSSNKTTGKQVLIANFPLKAKLKQEAELDQLSPFLGGLAGGVGFGVGSTIAKWISEKVRRKGDDDMDNAAKKVGGVLVGSELGQDPLLGEINSQIDLAGGSVLPVCTKAESKNLERCVVAVEKHIAATGYEGNPHAICRASIGCRLGGSRRYEEKIKGGLEQVRTLSTNTPEKGFTICRQNNMLLRGKEAIGSSDQSVSVPISCPYGGKPIGIHHEHPVSGGGSTDPSEQDIVEAKRLGLKWLCITVPEKKVTKCHQIS